MRSTNPKKTITKGLELGTTLGEDTPAANLTRSNSMTICRDKLWRTPTNSILWCTPMLIIRVFITLLWDLREEITEREKKDLKKPLETKTLWSHKWLNLRVPKDSRAIQFTPWTAKNHNNNSNKRLNLGPK